MADDFTMRLIHVYGQVIDCLKWSIDNKHLDCVDNLRPVVQGMASILADMVDRQEENLKRRGKMELSRNVGLGARPTSCNGRVMEEDYSMAKAEPELLLNKSEVDRTFSFNKIQWSQEASQMITPGWTVRVCDHESGAQVIGFDPSTDVGLSVQPYFQNDTRLPDMVIIANYFPLGMLPPITNKLRNEMQSLAQKEIGEAYSVILGHEVINKLEIFEFSITEL